MTERLTEQELAELAQVVKAATPGPWKATGLQFGCFYILTDDESGMVADDAPDTEAALARLRGYGQGLPMEANAAHIAAFNPQMADRLLQEIATLKAERESWELQERLMAEEVVTLRAERDALAQQVEALTERQQALDMIASPGTIEDFGNGWAVGIARKALSPKGGAALPAPRETTGDE